MGTGAPQLKGPQNYKHWHWSSTAEMSYGKKDEDADQAIVKVDRTSVFQEGKIMTA